MIHRTRAAIVLALLAIAVTAPHRSRAEEAHAVCPAAAPADGGTDVKIPPTRELSRRSATLLPPGYLHTSGSQIVDQAGRPVRIASVGWNQGFENPVSAMAKIASLGFNAVRLSWVDATLPRDLARIDAIVAAAGHDGVKVILDHHTNEAGTAADGYGAQQKNGLWYDSGPGTDGTNGAGVKGTVTQAVFQDHWVDVAKRYAGNSTVIGFDLDNEPLEYNGQSTWGDGGATDIRQMYQTVGNAILAVDPHVLIIAEGPQNYPAGMPWGDLSKVRDAPVVLNVPNQIVYSVHDYPAYVSGVVPDSGPRKVARMNHAWGYLVTDGIAPVWIGEMGANMDGSCCHETLSGSRAWASTLVNYLNGRLGVLGGPTFKGDEQGVSTDWWAWGYLPGQQLDGTLGPNGGSRFAQYAVYSQLTPWLPCGTAARVATPG
jgi:endoglucanase/chitinase